MASHNALKIVLLYSLLLAVAAPGILTAGTTVTVKGDVEEVVQKVEQALRKLEVEQAEHRLAEDHAMTVGKARSGSRLTVAVNRLDDDECELSVDSHSPADPDMEEKFLRLMQSR